MNATPAQMELIGREDGEFMFGVYRRLMARKLGDPETVRSTFETWATEQIQKCEGRLRNVGCSAKQIRMWRRGCGEALTTCEKELQHADAV